MIQRLHSQSPARRGTLDHLRAEGETLVNRSHPAPGVGPVAGHVAAGQMVGHIAVGTAAATVTLPTDTFEDDAGFEDGTVFLHRDVFCLPAHGTSVATARRRVGELLCAWGVAEPVHDDAALVVSELFTNALVHTDSTEITCRIQTTMETVYLAITDQGHGEPGPEVREPEEAEIPVTPSRISTSFAAVRPFATRSLMSPWRTATTGRKRFSWRCFSPYNLTALAIASAQES